MRRKSGFTLVEVLFVVLIAAGVLAFSVPAYQRMKERSAYNAATGTLLDIGNAVSSLERDVKVATGQSISFPGRTNAFTVTGTGSFNPSGSWASLDPKPAWNRWFVDYGPYASDFDTQFWGALFTFKYLEAINNDTYNFYVVMPGVNTGVCNSRCKDGGGSGSNSKVKACMCVKSGTTTKGCYYGAVFLEGGKIERITYDSTQCKNS